MNFQGNVLIEGDNLEVLKTITGPPDSEKVEVTQAVDMVPKYDIQRDEPRWKVVPSAEMPRHYNDPRSITMKEVIREEVRRYKTWLENLEASTRAELLVPEDDDDGEVEEWEDEPLETVAE